MRASFTSFLVLTLISLFASKGQACSYDPRDTNCASSQFHSAISYPHRGNSFTDNMTTTVALALGVTAPGKRDALLPNAEELIKKLKTELIRLKVADLEIPYASNQSGVCVSNGYQSILWLLGKVGSANLSESQIKSTVLARFAVLENSCNPWDKENGAKAKAAIRNIAGPSEFKTYLKASHTFYKEDFLAALLTFTKVIESGKYLTEAAQYMKIRIAIVSAQKEWDGWDNWEKIDKTQLILADKNIAKYLKAYPKGEFLESVVGYKRRTAYLRQDKEAFSKLVYAEFERQLSQGKPSVELWRIVRELHYAKLTPRGVHPLVTVAWLSTANDKQFKTASWENLFADKRWAKYPGLRQFAQVSIWQHQEKFAEIRKNSDQNLKTSGPWRGAIEVMTLDAYSRAKQFDKTEQLLAITKSIQPPLWDFKFAEIMLRNDDRLKMFENKRFKHAVMKENITAIILNEKELEKLASSSKYAKKDRQLATNSLLKLLLLKQNFKEFLRVYKKLGKPTDFSSVETAARTLATSPKDAKGLINVGYFIQAKNLSPYQLWMCSSSNEISWVAKNATRLFENESKSVSPPLKYYLAALEHGQTNDLKAKALYHLIKCFARQDWGRPECVWGYEDSSEEFPKSTRKKWFKTLKTKYPETSWAKKTKLYW